MSKPKPAALWIRAFIRRGKIRDFPVFQETEVFKQITNSKLDAE